MPRTFRVAMVAACPFPCPRGTPTRILRLAEALAVRGHEVHVVTYHLGDEVEGPFRTHRIRRVSGYGRTAPGPTLRKLVQLDPALARLLGRVVTDHGAEVIHAHHYEGLLCGSWVARRHALPLIYDAHTLLESELPSYAPFGTSRLAALIGRQLDRTLPPLARETVAVNGGIRDALARHARLAASRITVIPNGIEEAWYAGASLRERSTRHESIRTLIFAGNLAPYQGIELMLRSFRHVLAHRRDVRLRIVSRWSFDPYERLARDLGIREHIDLVDDDVASTPGHLAAADVALHPRPTCAGTPQKLLNYMAAGTPIVSFASSAPMLEHAKSAWLVEKEEESAFATATLECLAQATTARTVAEEACRIARHGYTWENAATQLEHVYARVCARA